MSYADMDQVFEEVKSKLDNTPEHVFLQDRTDRVIKALESKLSKTEVNELLDLLTQETTMAQEAIYSIGLADGKKLAKEVLLASPR